MKLRPYQTKLINDCKNELRAEHTSPCIVLPCGGGKSVITADIAHRATNKHNRVLFLVHRKELCDQIKSTFYRYGVDMHLVDVMMVQTASRRLGKLKDYALIITDEGHHCKANTYKKIYDYYKTIPKIFVTATPIRLGGESLGEICDSMCIGPSVKELIAMGNLSPYKYYAPTLADFSHVHTIAGELNAKEISSILDKSAIYGDVIKYYQKLANGKQGICYCVNVEHSKNTARTFREHGINARHIDGDTPSEIRADIIREFRNGTIKILCNVGLISEGFDVPNCDVCILLRPTKSLSLYIQQAMRCMRYKQGKTAIIIDHVGNYLRHGMPDDDREWSLEDKPKAKAREKPEKAVKVRVCKECFGTYPAELTVCPHCGAIYTKSQQELEEEKEVLLREIKEKDKEIAREFVKSCNKITDCQTFQQMVEWCKANNKKVGYAYHTWNNRNYKVDVHGF